MTEKDQIIKVIIDKMRDYQLTEEEFLSQDSSNEYHKFMLLGEELINKYLPGGNFFIINRENVFSCADGETKSVLMTVGTLNLTCKIALILSTYAKLNSLKAREIEIIKSFKDKQEALDDYELNEVKSEMRKILNLVPWKISLLYYLQFSTKFEREMIDIFLNKDENSLDIFDSVYVGLFNFICHHEIGHVKYSHQKKREHFKNLNRAQIKNLRYASECVSDYNGFNTYLNILKKGMEFYWDDNIKHHIPVMSDMFALTVVIIYFYYSHFEKNIPQTQNTAVKLIHPVLLGVFILLINILKINWMQIMIKII